MVSHMRSIYRLGPTVSRDRDGAAEARYGLASGSKAEEALRPPR
jgi:hypothetical protein